MAKPSTLLKAKYTTPDGNTLEINGVGHGDNRMDLLYGIKIICEALTNEDRTALSEHLGGASNTGLTFSALRLANLVRLPEFKNANGDTVHSDPDGRDWSPAQWLQAVTGELGEYANLRKKFERGDIGRIEFIDNARKELADIVIYLDILAYQLGIDLGIATIQKFNQVSTKIGSKVLLGGPTTEQPSELEMHRADYQDIQAAGFESPGELLAAYKNRTYKTMAALDVALTALDVAQTAMAHCRPDIGYSHKYTNASIAVNAAMVEIKKFVEAGKS